MALKFPLLNARMASYPKLNFEDEESKNLVKVWIEERKISLTKFKEILYLTGVEGPCLNIRSTSPHKISLSNEQYTWDIILYDCIPEICVVQNVNSSEKILNSCRIFDSDTIILMGKQHILGNCTSTTYYESFETRKIFECGKYTVLMDIVYTSDKDISNKIQSFNPDFWDLFFEMLDISEIYNFREIWATVKTFIANSENTLKNIPLINLQLTYDEKQIANFRICKGKLTAYGERNVLNEKRSLCYDSSDKTYTYQDLANNLTIKHENGNIDVHFAFPQEKNYVFDMEHTMLNIERWLDQVTEQIEQYNEINNK